MSMHLQLTMLLLLMLLLHQMLISSSQQQRHVNNPTTLNGVIGITTDILTTSLNWIGNQAGIIESCPFVTNIMQSLNQTLPNHICSQEAGLSFIYNAVASWEFLKRSGRVEPLVLAFTGSTGVGKTETAYRFASSILSKETRVGSSKRFLPKGLLTFRGEDYSVSIGLTVAEMQNRIRNQLIDHLSMCSENAVIVFDEVQKVMPGVLEVLSSSLGERGFINNHDIPFDSSTTASTTTSTTSASSTGATKRFSTEKCIFIFISDIGADRMIKLLLAYGSKESIPRTLLRSEVKLALDEQWQRQNFGKLITEVVPFLPLEQQDIKKILQLKIRTMATDNMHTYWLDFVVDDAVIDLLSSAQYIKYSNHSTKIRIPAATATTITGGDTKISSDAIIENNTTTVTRSKVFATWGARSLENAGPLLDLRSIIFRYMQPWRPGQLLHVGCADSTTRQLQKIHWGDQYHSVGSDGDDSSDGSKRLYLNWCVITNHDYIQMKARSVDGVVKIKPEFAFSNACETLWIGEI